MRLRRRYPHVIDDPVPVPIAVVIALLLGSSITALAYTQFGGHDVTVRNLTAPIAAGLGRVAPDGYDLTVSLPQAPIVATQPPVAEAANGVAVGPLPKLTADLRTQFQRYQGRSIFGVEGRMPNSPRYGSRFAPVSQPASL